MDNSIYEGMKVTYVKNMMDVFAVLEFDIKDKYKQYGIEEFKDYRNLAHKMITEIVEDRYLNN